MTRSSRPRKRSRVLRIVLLAGAATMLFLGWRAYVIMYAKPGTSVSYQQKVVDLAKSRAVGTEDAWKSFVGLIERHAQLQADIRSEAPTFNYTVHPDYSTLTSPIFGQRELTGDENLDPAIVAENAIRTQEYELSRDWARTTLSRWPERGIDAEFDRLVEAPFAARPLGTEPTLMERSFTELGASRQIARGLKARMQLDLERGDYDAFATNFERTMALARHLGAQSTLIERLVAVAIMAMATNELREQMVARQLPAEALQKLLWAMDRQAKLPPLSYHVEGERLQTLDFLQGIHSDDGNGDGRRIMTRARTFAGHKDTPRVVNLGAIFLPSKKEMVDVANQIHDGVAKAADTPRREDRKRVFDYDAYVATLDSGYSLLTQMGTVWASTFNSHDVHLMTISGTRTLLAIELFRAEQKRLPASLDELVPKYLAQMPDDPFAADGRLRYKVLTEPDAHGRTYLLYSVGSNATDDGGVRPKNMQDAVSVGTGDYILNEPREVE